MLMLLCTTTAVTRMRAGVSIGCMRPGVSVGCSASGPRPGTRHGSVRCSTDATVSAQGENDARLMTWFAQKGGSGSVAVATQAGLRGLVATRDVQVSDVLLALTLTLTRTRTRTLSLTLSLTLTLTLTRSATSC